MPRPFERAFHDRARHAHARFHPFARARIERPAMTFNQLRLVVVKIALARTPIHEELNDTLRFRGEVSTTCGFGRFRSEQSFTSQERSERNPAEPRADVR
jgi:hypothetical protein